MKQIIFALLLLIATGSAAIAQPVTLPPNFNWGSVPSQYAGKTLVIKYHFTPGSIDIRLPADVILKFDGGSLKGFRTLEGNKTSIVAPKTAIFDPGSKITGQFVNTVAMPEWFGARGDDRTNDAAAVAATISSFSNIRFTGKYFIPAIIIPIDKPSHFEGAPGATLRGDGGNIGRFSVKNSITVKALHFDQFRFCFYVDHDHLVEDIIFQGNRFTRIEKPIFAPNNNLVQKLKRVEISGNRFTDCTAGVELFCHLSQVRILNNRFLNLGHATLQKQANAIRLGNSALNNANDNTIGDFHIAENHITNVLCGQHDGAEGYECHGIMAIGNRVRIIGNHLENIYNGGVKGNARIKTGSEGIYVKGDHAYILDNTLINAGFGEGAICVKGLNSGIMIRGNTISYSSDLADHSQLITCYFRDTLEITGNILESVAMHTTAIKLCNVTDARSKAVVQENQIKGVKGYGFKIMNRFPGSAFIISMNAAINIQGDVIKEESSQPYALMFRENVMEVKDGFFIPSSRSNDVTFSGNKVKATGNTKINNLYNGARLVLNRFEIHSASWNPLFFAHHRSSFHNNEVMMYGAWRYVLMLNNEQSGEVNGNTFNLIPGSGSIERAVIFNTATAGLAFNFKDNRFTGNAAQANTILVSVSNAGLKELTLSGNGAGKNTGVFLEVRSPLQYGCFINNNTACRNGFVSPASLQNVQQYYSCGNNQLSEHEPEKQID
ncbi:MAG: hypothetical protein R6V49_00600 [Bacteroidales bacterium]